MESGWNLAAKGDCFQHTLCDAQIGTSPLSAADVLLEIDSACSLALAS